MTLFQPASRKQKTRFQDLFVILKTRKMPLMKRPGG